MARTQVRALGGHVGYYVDYDERKAMRISKVWADPSVSVPARKHGKNKGIARQAKAMRRAEAVERHTALLASGRMVDTRDGLRPPRSVSLPPTEDGEGR